MGRPTPHHSQALQGMDSAAWVCFPVPALLVRRPRDYLGPSPQCPQWGWIQAPIHQSLQVSTGLISRSTKHSTLPLPVPRGSEQAIVRLGALVGKDCVFSVYTLLTADQEKHTQDSTKSRPWDCGPERRRLRGRDGAEMASEVGGEPREYCRPETKGEEFFRKE